MARNDEYGLQNAQAYYYENPNAFDVFRGCPWFIGWYTTPEKAAAACPDGWTFCLNCNR